MNSMVSTESPGCHQISFLYGRGCRVSHSMNPVAQTAPPTNAYPRRANQPNDKHQLSIFSVENGKESQP